MKRRLLFVLTIVGFLFATALFAQASAQPKAAKMKVKGEIVSVDALAKSMVVKTGSSEMTFDMTNARFGKKDTAEDLKTGDNVLVTYTETDGTMVATHVKKHHGKKDRIKAVKQSTKKSADTKPTASTTVTRAK